MAYTMIEKHQDTAPYFEFICDSDADVATIPEVFSKPGSQATVPLTGNASVWMCNNSGEWVKL